MGMGVWNFSVQHVSDRLQGKRTWAQKSEESQGGSHAWVAAEGTTVGRALRKTGWGPAWKREERTSGWA